MATGSGGRNQRDGLDWKFSQVFGERAPGEQILDVDVISTIEFEKKGDYLAVGDHGGRIILFERVDEKSTYFPEWSDGTAAVYPRYFYMTEFQSHEPEFDYLKSLEIEEKISKLRWYRTLNNSLLILSTNNRTIKLWKVQEQKVKKVKEMLQNSYVSSENALLSQNSLRDVKDEQLVPSSYRLEWINKNPKLLSSGSQERPLFFSGRAFARLFDSPPKPYLCFRPLRPLLSLIKIPNDEEAATKCRRVYAHAHEYNVHSISINSDGETFLSSDDLRVNLWNLEISHQCFNIIDMKPQNMEDLIEVITTAEFHPTYCNLLAYGSSRGFIRLVDMRVSALCDHTARILQAREAQASSSIFSEIISSISDIKFGFNRMHILSRDYMNLKLWDLRMEKSPVVTFKVHEHLRPKLADLYENDSVFDKFECCISADGLNFATGSYSNIFRIFSRDGGSEEGITLEASKNPNQATVCQRVPKPRLMTTFARSNNRQGSGSAKSDGTNGVPGDGTSKLTHMAWHPTTNLIACAAANTFNKSQETQKITETAVRIGHRTVILEGITHGQIMILTMKKDVDSYVYSKRMKNDVQIKKYEVVQLKLLDASFSTGALIQ